MIDLDRAKERVYHALGWLQGNIQEPAFYGSCDKIDEITDDVEALCREVEEQRSLISELRRDKESYRQTANSKAARVADLEVQRDELRRELHRIQYKESK